MFSHCSSHALSGNIAGVVMGQQLNASHVPHQFESISERESFDIVPFIEVIVPRPYNVSGLFYAVGIQFVFAVRVLIRSQAHCLVVVPIALVCSGVLISDAYLPAFRIHPW